MKNGTSLKYLISGIRISLGETEETALKKAKEKMKRGGISTSTLHFQLYKKSVDARRHDAICFECTVLATALPGDKPISDAALLRIGAKRLLLEGEPLSRGSTPLSAPPLVIGMGPAGLFAALLLAENGYAPILIDRGAPVEERVADVERFRNFGILNTESNIQFGAGGAGTFSDGKLITRIHDRRCQTVLETLCRFGAPKEILTRAKPHIGTDILRVVVSNLLAHIESLGGKLHYHCCMQDFRELPDGTLSIKTNQGEFVCGAMILAPGHSSRDTYLRLIEKDFAIEPKPISVGVRVEHLQADIDKALYGKYAGHPDLGPAEYSLSDTRGERGVYTFCMCPGGEVVAAASEEEHLVVNGMSYHARNGKNANSAVAVSVTPNDLEPVNGNLALGAIAFQRKLERGAYLAGGGNYVAPIATMGDFLAGRCGKDPSRITPSYRGGMVKPADMEEIFPPFVIKSLRYGFAAFGKKLLGYDTPDAVLTAAETRTSAPIRILREKESMTSPGHPLIYPSGEGAGYAGGITSAAVDGLRSAEALISHFAPIQKN